MSGAQRLKLVAQVSRLGHGHVRRVKQASPGGRPLPVWAPETPVDRLAHNCGDRHASRERQPGEA